MLLENRTRLNALDVGLGYAAPEDPPDRAAQDDGLSPDAGTLADLTMRFNFAAYLEASARDRTRIRMPAPDNTAPPAARPTSGTRSESASPGLPTRRTPGVFRPIASFDPPQHMMSTDALMRAHLGTGLDGIRAVLGTAVDWTSDAAVAVTEPQTLAQAAEEWSGLPRAEVDAAVILLSLNTRNLHDEASRYWEVERRSQRLRVRPFPVIGTRMWIMPWAAAATQELFTVYFQDSRLPYSDPALPPSAAIAMQRHRSRRNLQLEVEAGAAGLGSVTPSGGTRPSCSGSHPRRPSDSVRAPRSARLGGASVSRHDLAVTFRETGKQSPHLCELRAGQAGPVHLTHLGPELRCTGTHCSGQRSRSPLGST
jgi:hypothetical protein